MYITPTHPTHRQDNAGIRRRLFIAGAGVAGWLAAAGVLGGSGRSSKQRSSRSAFAALLVNTCLPALE